MKIEEINLIHEKLVANGGPLALKAANAIQFLMDERKAKGRVQKPIDPLHRRCILMHQKRIDVESRDKSEFLAWEKAKSILNENRVQILEWFYKLPKSAERDETWNRKSNPTIMMNNISSQIEMATALKERIDKRDQRSIAYQLPEPKDWRSRVAGELPRYTWDYICKNWSHEAKALQDPNWKMEDVATAGLAELSSLLKQVDKEMKTTEEIYL